MDGDNLSSLLPAAGGLTRPDLRCAACGADSFPHFCPGRTNWRITLAMIGGAK